MNITFLDFDDIQNPLLGAGQAIATYQVGKQLVKMGHNVTVFCSRYPGYKDRIQDGIKYMHIGLGSKYVKLNNALYFFMMPFSTSRLNKKNCDIIVESLTAPISFLFTPLFTKVPVVCLPSMFNAKEFALKYHLPFEFFENLGSKLYKYFMPYSNNQLEKIQKINKNINYKIVYQGVGEEFYKIRLVQPEHILFLGRFDVWQKGIDLLLEAFSKVRNQIKYPLIIAGHGPDENGIRNEIAKLGLSEKVKIVGSAYGQKKADLLSKALFVAFPSRHEEMSLWSLEAIASGQPLVCFDLDEHYWLTDEVSLKATKFDVSDYAKLLIKMSRENAKHKYEKNCRNFAKKFSWEKVAKQFVLFFEEVIDYEKNN